jgi:predicted small lipoprotein YifL
MLADDSSGPPHLDFLVTFPELGEWRTPAPYTSAMRNPITLLLVTSLTACGMTGDLYEPAPPAEPAAEPAPALTPEAMDKGERKTIPSTPDPAQSQ